MFFRTLAKVTDWFTFIDFGFEGKPVKLNIIRRADLVQLRNDINDLLELCKDDGY